MGAYRMEGGSAIVVHYQHAYGGTLFVMLGFGIMYVPEQDRCPSLKFGIKNIMQMNLLTKQIHRLREQT